MSAYPDGKGGANLHFEDSRKAINELMAEYHKCCPKGGTFTTEYVENYGGTVPVHYDKAHFPEGLPTEIDGMSTVSETN